MDKNRRHIILINREFQVRLISKFIIINILIMIIFGFFLYIFLNSEVETNLLSAHVTYKNVKDMLFPIILTLSIINMLVSSIIIAVFVLYASHKVAGPLYRFNEALKDILNKNLKTFTALREGDQLYDCSITLTQVSQALTEDMSEIKNGITEVKNLCSKSGGKEKLIKKLKELENLISQYQL
ncbi:MAG: hypothetical protein V1874_09655 [Spirochaetota bacterium]